MNTAEHSGCSHRGFTGDSIGLSQTEGMVSPASQVKDDSDLGWSSHGSGTKNLPIMQRDYDSLQQVLRQAAERIRTQGTVETRRPGKKALSSLPLSSSSSSLSSLAASPISSISPRRPRLCRGISLDMATNGRASSDDRWKSEPMPCTVTATTNDFQKRSTILVRKPRRMDSKTNLSLSTCARKLDKESTGLVVDNSLFALRPSLLSTRAGVDSRPPLSQPHLAFPSPRPAAFPSILRMTTPSPNKSCLLRKPTTSNNATGMLPETPVLASPLQRKRVTWSSDVAVATRRKFSSSYSCGDTSDHQPNLAHLPHLLRKHTPAMLPLDTRIKRETMTAVISSNKRSVQSAAAVSNVNSMPTPPVRYASPLRGCASERSSDSEDSD